MRKHDNTEHTESPRKGRSLDNKLEHKRDHMQHSRRSFLLRSSLIGAGLTMPFGNHVLKAMSPSPLVSALNNTETDRILVVVRLYGGCDGLNTIIPRGSSEYYSNRQDIAISEEDMVVLDAENGLHPGLSELSDLYFNNKMTAIHNVGYENPNYSHFTSGDIWSSARESSGNVESTGWVARYVDTVMPSFIEAPPTYPPAMEIGTTTDKYFRGKDTNVSLALTDVQQFYDIAQLGELYPTTGLGNCNRDQEVAFLRQVANSNFYYSEAIQNAYNAAQAYPSPIEYPSTSYNLGESLHVVSQMIKGNLGTKIYMVKLGGFDTHIDQETRLPAIFEEYSRSINAFMNDLNAHGFADKVITMSFSEFGRTWQQNASYGTDHGTGGPVFLYGSPDNISTGIIGSQPDLTDLSYYDDPEHEHDFKQIYAALLKNWLCVDPMVVNHVLKNDIDPLPGLVTACNYQDNANNRAALLGHRMNMEDLNVIDIYYATNYNAKVKIEILNQYGQLLFTLEDKISESGSHILSFSRNDYDLPVGDYYYRLKTSGETHTKRLKLF